MWCEQNKKRALNAGSHLWVNVLPYCDDTIRAARLRGWWSRRVASGARVTSCSHSRSQGGNYRQFFPALPFTAALARFRHPDFLGRCSRECKAFLGSLVCCRPPRASQRAVLLLHHHSVQLSRFSMLQRRRFFCSFSNRPMALGLARDDPLAGAPALDAHSMKVSEPLLQWRKVQMDSGLALLGVQNLLSLLF